MSVTHDIGTNEYLDRRAITKMVMQLFDHWKVSSSDQIEMLGLAPNNRSALSRYRKGKPIASSRDAIERVGHLLAIHKNLRLLFLHNEDLAYRWISTRNRAFEGRTPIEVIRDFGFAGLLRVRNYLDRMLNS